MPAGVIYPSGGGGGGKEEGGRKYGVCIFTGRRDVCRKTCGKDFRLFAGGFFFIPRDSSARSVSYILGESCAETEARGEGRVWSVGRSVRRGVLEKFYNTGGETARNLKKKKSFRYERRRENDVMM